MNASETSSDNEAAPKWLELDEQIAEGEEKSEGIGSKTEKFLVKFYEKIKMHRLGSWIQYNGMVLISVS